MPAPYPDTMIERAVKIVVAAVSNDQDVISYPDKVTKLLEAVIQKLMELDQVGRG